MASLQQPYLPYPSHLRSLPLNLPFTFLPPSTVGTPSADLLLIPQARQPGTEVQLATVDPISLGGRGGTA